MINEPDRFDSSAPAEPSSAVLMMVLEIDAALNAGRVPQWNETSLQSLSPEERTQLESIAQELQFLYAQADFAHRAHETVKEDQAATCEAIDRNEDLEVSPDLRAFLGIHGASFGRFEILQGLGMGGHGVVFLARDPVLGRMVALKMPRPDVLLNPGLKKRFLAEGRAAALLTHPNIVTVFESGEVGAVCYLAQDYIPGPSLMKWLRYHPEAVPPRIAARILLQLADAVGLAHSRRILHRDIKPGNILLAPMENRQTADELDGFQPQLADFGMAKLLQDPDQTRTGGVLGTPAYMSPEQAGGQIDLVGQPADIYSLGAVLYELLSHHPPYHGASDLETLQHVLHRDPPRLRSLVPDVPRDLEAICQKCMRRDPQERYAQAHELVDDLRRFLENRPVRARPQSWSRAAAKWARRNPSVAALSLLVGMSLLISLAGSLWFNARLNDSLETVRQQKSELQQQTLTLRRRVYAEDMSRAAEAYHHGRVAEVRQRLDAWLPKPEEPDFRNFPWWMMQNLLEDASQVIGTFPPGAKGAAIAVHPTRKLVITGEPDGVIRLRKLPEGELVAELRGHAPGDMNAMHLLPIGDRELLASGSDDGTVRLWNLDTGEQILRIEAHQGDVMAVQFLGQDCEAIASAGADSVIRIWSRGNGELLSELKGHTKTVRALVERRSSGTLFSSGQDDTVRVWDWQQARSDPRFGAEGLPMIVGQGWSRTLALSPDENTLAAALLNGSLATWDLRPDRESFGKLLREIDLDPGGRVMVWRDHDSLLMGHSAGQLSHVSTATSARPQISSLPAHSDWVLGLDLIPDQHAPGFVTISKDGIIRCWRPSAIDGDMKLEGLVSFRNRRIAWQGSTLAVRDDSELLIFAMPERQLRFRQTVADWLPTAWMGLLNDGSKIIAIAGSSDRPALITKTLGAAGSDGTSSFPILQTDRIPAIGTISPDQQLALIECDREVFSIDLKSGERRQVFVHPLSVNGLIVCPRRNALISSCEDGDIRFWDIPSGRLLESHAAHTQSAHTLAISPDGQLLATIGDDQFIRVWQIDGWKEICAFGANEGVGTLAFVDDGRTLVSQDSKQLVFWSIPDQLEILRWPLPDTLEFVLSPDHTEIAAQQYASVRLFRGAPPRP